VIKKHPLGWFAGCAASVSNYV